MTLEDELRSKGVKVNGTLDYQAAFDCLAAIFSRKYNAIITFKLPENVEGGEKVEQT